MIMCAIGSVGESALEVAVFRWLRIEVYVCYLPDGVASAFERECTGERSG
jgi:hypothetical protein